MKHNYICGPFPPPVHGMSKNLLIFYEDCLKKSKNIKTQTLDISPGTLNRGFTYHTKKIIKVINAVRTILSLNSNEANNFYIPPDGGLGKLYTLIITLAAKRKFCHLYIHHRSYQYIDSPSHIYKYLFKVISKHSTHIFLSEHMQQRFQCVYQTTCSLVISNAMHVQEPAVRSAPTSSIKLGFLSNISFEKGIKEVVNVFNQLSSAGVNVTLDIAGPYENKDAQNFVESAIKIKPDKITYHGYVSGEKKSEFYKQLDFFLFPTAYVNEAQPNVLFEAASFGALIVSTDKGSIKHDFDGIALVYDTASSLSNLAPKDIYTIFQDGALTSMSQVSKQKISLQISHSRRDYEKLITKFSTYEDTST